MIDLCSLTRYRSSIVIFVQGEYENLFKFVFIFRVKLVMSLEEMLLRLRYMALFHCSVQNMYFPLLYWKNKLNCQPLLGKGARGPSLKALSSGRNMDTEV